MKGKIGSVYYEKLDFSDVSKNRAILLADEIPGVIVRYSIIPKHETLLFPPAKDCIRIFILVEGDLEFISSTGTLSFDERVIYVPDPDLEIKIKADKKSLILEIQWDIVPDDVAIMEAFRKMAPFVQVYSDSALYKEDCKSAKTLSRSILLQNVLPRICMGSVETTGFDRVEPHDHQYIDQLFFTFPENEMTLLVGNERYRFEGNTLLHIPLGSNHGAEVAEGNTLHYIWIDFIIDAKGLEYLDSAHKMIDKKGE